VRVRAAEGPPVTALRVGDAVIVKSNPKIEAEVIAISGRTAGLTLRITRGDKAWHPGDRMHAMPYEVTLRVNLDADPASADWIKNAAPRTRGGAA
jgi:hypothetical protein